jgi:hypothetical protein
MADNGDELRALFLDRISGRDRCGVRTIVDDNADDAIEVDYEPVSSIKDATLWLRRYHPERLEDWLMKQDPRLRLWLDRQPLPKPKVLLW